METTPNETWKQIEQKNYTEHDDQLKRRLSQAAWKSLEWHQQYPEKHEPVILGRFVPSSIREKRELQVDNAGHSEKDSSFEKEQKMTESMRRLIWQNLLDSRKELKELDFQEVSYGLLLDAAKREKKSRVSSRSEFTDSIRDEIDDIRRQREELATKTPESFTLVHGLELREHIKQVQAGEMVTTPYVEERLSRVEKNISEGRPSFLHGHLGSGKTELAINAARNAAINRAAYEEAMSDAIKHVEQNPDSSDDDNFALFGRLFLHHQARFQKAAHKTDEFSPLIVSGSKDLTSQDLFADKTLKLTKFNGKPLLEHKEDLDAQIAQWEAEHPEEAKDPEKAKAAAAEILELFKLKHQAFGTEVEIIKQAIYRGVEEGRPVIIDEVNAIPAVVLISLNDVLQRRPGESCYIPGVGTKTIQPGFALIMTGNLSTNSINYGGVEELNPAFLSRLDVIEHDYLPMSETDSSYKEQIDPQKNELFYVMIAYLADRQGNLQLPEMDKTLDKLFSLCQLAHETQLVFEGKWRESISTNSGDEFEPSLEKSVLSIRNLLNVLKEWDKGSEKDLDKALWDGFIASITKSDDQNLILSLAKRHGFFSERDGWRVQIKEYGASSTSLSEIHPEPFQHMRKPLETYSVRKTVELLYGPGPDREIYPEDINLDEIEDLANDEVSLNDLESFSNKLSELDNTIQALSILGEQCGCNINSTTEGA